MILGENDVAIKLAELSFFRLAPWRAAKTPCVASEHHINSKLNEKQVFLPKRLT